MFSGTVLAFFFLLCSAIQLNGISEANCGDPYFKPLRLQGTRLRNRILNGYEAREHSHPWQALLVIHSPNFKTKMCGGTLIDLGSGNESDLVLTAAHCIMDSNVLRADYEFMKEMKFYYERWRSRDKYAGVPLVNVSQVSVFLGVHDMYVQNENVQRLAVVGRAVGLFHQYEHREDIALLKLERKVGYNNFIQGICLPTPKEDLPGDGYPCYVTGWGFLDRKKTIGRKLRQVEVDIFKDPKCNDLVHSKTMFCAGSKTRNIGTCSGDSGGPLSCQKDGKFILYGVVSFSSGLVCSHKDEPTVFAKVPVFIEWIKKETRELADV